MSRTAFPESVLERVLRVIEAVGAAPEAISRREIAAVAGLPKATTNRLVAQLIGERILQPAPTGVRLGIRLFELGSLAERQGIGLHDASLPHLEDLYEITHQTVQVGVLDDLEVVYLQKISGQRSSHLDTRIGARMPLNCTGSGKVLLAFSSPEFLDRLLAERGLTTRTPRSISDPDALRRHLAVVRQQGYAVDDEEFQLGTTSVSAPVFQKAEVVAAVALSGPTERIKVANAAMAVRATAAAVTRSLDRRQTHERN
ncbi:IclR family transcriptional regulator [Agromyces aerolatus]|uniref:IclR family transcriptional regulator n=1 Tax=Agromyces sp. LY-1074 TaxID=3074080 RepID=UPI00285A811C|nr:MULTISPECIES: IclR family transcriptional regulator [unclassified Agromyces]MDR5700956.1 IclR family transcriptional regulator [Agromyces sp. LY-1074]MDR5707383.1 IclR family transcriptional regulator [Agromyces sp. LY-1358]